MTTPDVHERRRLLAVIDHLERENQHLKEVLTRLADDRAEMSRRLKEAHELVRRQS